VNLNMKLGFVIICVFTFAFVICNWEGGRASPLCFYFVCGIGWVTKLLSLIISLVFVYSSCNIPFLCRLWNRQGFIKKRWGLIGVLWWGSAGQLVSQEIMVRIVCKMKLSYSPLALFILFLVEWMDCGLYRCPP